MTFVLLILSLLVFQYASAVLRTGPLVNTKVGLIRGLQADDGDYSMFMGIPYARVDERNPFGPSFPQPNFEETFDAFDDSAMCPQVEQFNSTISGTLDCLHINVYVPNTASSTNRLPVLVWIYGGALQIGFAGRYVHGPRFLVRHDILLVTLNYRVGPYGFMCLDVPEVPGNQGLKDQRLALKWIKDNIEAFGGDAYKITLSGQSAGAMSVDHHIHSTHEDLFQQAILQSGVILTPMLRNSLNEAPLRLAEHLGFATGDVTEALSFLATVDTSNVIAANRELNLNFRFCVEKAFENVERFLGDYPVNLKDPEVNNVPIMIGFTNDEWLSRYAHAGPEFFEQSGVVDLLIRESFDFGTEFEEAAGDIRRFYMGDAPESVETRRPIINIASDFDFLHPARRSLTKYFDNGAHPIFSYVFSYDGERNYIKYRNNITIGGAAHGDEIGYLFDVEFLATVMPDEDQLVVDRMTAMWANFVKYGNPTPETSELLPVSWIPATSGRWNYLNIDSELTMETRPFNDRMAFLDLFYKTYEEYHIGFRR